MSRLDDEGFRGADVRKDRHGWIAAVSAASQTDTMLCLAITGFEADPDEVTKLLQLEPTSTVRRGELGRSGRPSQFNGWWLEAHKARVTDGGQHDAALGALIDHLRGREARFATLRDKLGPRQVTIYGGLYFSPEEQCGVWLEPEQIKALASCGVGWGLDLFVADDGAT